MPTSSGHFLVRRSSTQTRERVGMSWVCSDYAFPSFANGLKISMPTELIDRIVNLVLLSKLKNVNGLVKSDFSCIAAFSLASSRFRQIALRRYFAVLHLWTSHHWNKLWKLLMAQGEDAFAWVRVIHIRAEVLASAPARLNFLPNVQALFVDLSLAGVATQETILKKIFKNFHTQQFKSAIPSPTDFSIDQASIASGPSRLTCLTLTALPFIDNAFLTLIAKTLPALTSLYLSCTDRLELGCCWDCFQDSAGCAIGIFPIPDMFADVSLLANTFANALKPLTRLIHLHLGIFLADETFFDSHLNHVGDVHPFELDFGEADIPFGPEECPICRETAPVSEEFERELVASKIIVKRLKSLQTIGWSTFFGHPGGHFPPHEGLHDMVGDWERSTRVWVSRKDGKIRLKGLPWS